jgi:hypothetical protein
VQKEKPLDTGEIDALEAEVFWPLLASGEFVAVGKTEPRQSTKEAEAMTETNDIDFAALKQFCTSLSGHIPDERISEITRLIGDALRAKGVWHPRLGNEKTCAQCGEPIKELRECGVDPGFSCMPW